MEKQAAKPSKPLTVDDLHMKVGKRGFITGKTGSGKTSLAYVLTEQLYENQPIIIIDPKGSWNIPSYGILWHGPKYPIEGSYVVYRPEWGTDPAEEIDTICEMIYENGKAGHGCALYVDELIPLLGRDTINGPRNLKFLYTQGRQLGITTLLGTQRPSSVPMYTMTESEYLYCFELRNIKDRARMGDFFGDEFRQPLPRYWFRFYTEEDDIYPGALSLPQSEIQRVSPGWS